jgi:hypothetical protein
MSFVPFIDITGVHAHLAPLVKGGVRAYYATGSQGIEETAAQILAAKAAGMGVILIDQTPSLALFAAGLADVADIEGGAAVPRTAADAVAVRQTHTWQSTLYVSFNALAALKAAIRNPHGVLYFVADYSWSLAGSEKLLGEHADWAACQYGDPASNPRTLVPGTNVTLRQANADIDVAKASWANQFLPKPTPPPVPAGPYPHVADGTKSLAQIAADLRTTEAALLAESAQMLTRTPLHKGTQYWTPKP